jgi:ABC-type arginine transport system permease subunit
MATKTRPSVFLPNQSVSLVANPAIASISKIPIICTKVVSLNKAINEPTILGMDIFNYEAADASGLSFTQKMVFIILPQALKISIPNIVGSFKTQSLR